MAYVKVNGKKYKVQNEKSVTHVFAILDRSGSMAGLVQDTVGGYNEFISGLEGTDSKVTLTLFDHEMITPYVDTDISEVPKLTKEVYSPRGMTALIDAVYATVKEYEGNVGPDDKAIVLIITDGKENASHKHTTSDLNRLVTRLDKKNNWTFTYLGANQDSWDTVKGWGFQHGNVSNYSASSAGTAQAFSSMSMNSVRVANSSAGAVKDFYVDDKDKLENAK